MIKNQKGFVNIVLIAALVAILAGAAGFLFFVKKSEITAPSDNQNQQQITDIRKSINGNVLFSNYGFSITIPNGWHLWEGYSAVLNLMEKEGDNFVSSYEAGWTQEQINTYQKFLNSWTSEDARILVFTNADVDYKNRNFTDAGKTASTIVDSDDMLNLGAIEMIISTGEVKLGEESFTNDKQERGYISVDGVGARYGIGKNKQFVDQIILLLPINSNKYIDGEKVKSITFSKFVKKDDSKALSKLVFFVSEMHIATSP